MSRERGGKDGGKRADARDAEVARAIDLHRGGRIADAWAIYERVLRDDPDHVTAVHFGGLLAFQQSERELGLAMVERALELDPDYVDARNNLGNMLKLQNRLSESEAQYRRVLESDPHRLEPMINLGVLARGRRAYDESEAWYRRAIEHDPDNPLVWSNLSGLLDSQGRTAEALDALQVSIDKAAGDDLSQEHLHVRRANILFRLGRYDDAAQIYRRMLDGDPGNETARHMLAALSGDAVPERAGEAYVRTLFDRFARSFDEVLDNLDYKAPALVGAVVARHYDGAGLGLRVLDAGCGTGLCGRHLETLATTLSGVDLSTGMLEQAKVTGCYDELIEAEIVTFLQDAGRWWDLIVSADTFCYFGALRPLLDAVGGALAPGGRLVFTVEREDGAPERGYVLHPHGRYAHTRGAVIEELARAGLVPESVEDVTLRLERGEPVRGFLVSAKMIRRTGDIAPAG